MDDDSKQIETIAALIAGARHAEAVIGLAELEGQSPKFRQAFWREVQRQSLEHVPMPEPESLRVLDYEAAKRFESKQISFGRHAGQRFGDVPIEYLEWLADSALDLQAYLRSVCGQKRSHEGDRKG